MMFAFRFKIRVLKLQIIWAYFCRWENSLTFHEVCKVYVLKWHSNKKMWIIYQNSFRESLPTVPILSREKIMSRVFFFCSSFLLYSDFFFISFTFYFYIFPLEPIANFSDNFRQSTISDLFSLGPFYFKPYNLVALDYLHLFLYVSGKNNPATQLFTFYFKLFAILEFKTLWSGMDFCIVWIGYSLGRQNL